MKSKAEEIRQFGLFLGRIEKGGYLDQMFGNMFQYVEGQIGNDFAVDIRGIIQGYEEANNSLVQKDREIAQLKEALVVAHDAQEQMTHKINALNLKVGRLERIENDVERLQLKVSGFQEDNGNLTQEMDQLLAELRTTENRLQSGKEEISRLKAKLFDYLEEIEELKKRPGPARC